MRSKNLSGTIELNDWIDYIPDDTFCECTTIHSIIMHRYPKWIGDNAFYKAINLEHIYIKKENGSLDEDWTMELQSIGDYAFYNTALLGSLQFSDTIETIGKFAFYNCIYLTDVNLLFANKLSSIQESTFSNCKLMTEISLPNSVKPNCDTVTLINTS